MTREGGRFFHWLKRSVFLALFLAFFSGVPASAMTPATISVGQITNPLSVIIYVGDSRTYALYSMGSASRKVNDVFISKGGGVVEEILKYPLYSYLKAAIKRFPSAPVILNFGVNGMQGNEDGKNIVLVYQKLFKSFPRTRFFVESINPTAFRAGIHSNRKVLAINKTLSRSFPGRYIDCYNYLLNKGIVNLNGTKGFLSRDRVHYNWATCREILTATRGWITVKLTGRALTRK